MTTPFSAPTIPVTVTKAIPNNLATQLGLTGAQQAVGQQFRLKQNDALQLIRGGYAQEGSDTTTGVGSSTPARMIVTVIKAIPNNLATQLSLTGAQQAVGQELTLKADDALMLVRNGYAYITKAADNSGRGTEGIQGVHAFTLDFPSVAAGAAAALTVNVVSAAVSDPVILGAPALLPAGVIPVAFVSAAGVVTIRIENQSAAAVDLAASVWKVALLKGAAN